MRAVLGIDTSNYTSSCALVGEDHRLLNSQRKLLPVPPGERGLRQSEAVFFHIGQLPALLSSLREGCDADIAAVCVAEKPVDQQASYMPVFQVGLSIAQSLAALMGIPCYLTTHQRGHIAAAGMGIAGLPEAHLALHLSGGTTELLAKDGESLRLLGQSLDLHAGQLIDRLGVNMGLPFPAGPELEKLALKGAAHGRYKISLIGRDCHLSGIEAQAMRDFNSQAIGHEQIAAELFDALARTAAGMLKAAGHSSGLQQALIFGGIAASALFRQLLGHYMESELRLRFGKPELSGDNAAGVALIGARMHFS